MKYKKNDNEAVFAYEFNNGHNSEKSIGNNVEKRKELERLFVEIQKELEIYDEYSLECIKNFIHKLVVFLVRNSSCVRNKNVPEYVNVITEYIKANYHSEISLQKLSRIVGMNMSYISRKFKEFKRIGVSEYVNIVRINEAAKLLKNTNFSIIRIANEVGYNDSSYFAMIFKQKMGVTPKKYRNDYCEIQ